VSNFPAKKYPPRDPSAPFKQYPDSGNLHAVASKFGELSPDYFGELAINLKDMTAVRVEDGLTVFKLSGWKVKSPNGKTYLKIKLNRFVATDVKAPVENKTGFDDSDSDVPF
jgi:hypothetical protein